MTDPRAEMSIYDRMHPRCREAIANAPYNFNLLSMPKTALGCATGTYGNYEPARFVVWLERQIAAVRRREARQ